MTFLLLLIAFGLGLCIGGYFVYKHEERIITELNTRCSEASERLNTMIKEEEQFIATIHSNIAECFSMPDDLVDYLKAKYMHEASPSTSDNEDEIDHLYI